MYLYLSRHGIWYSRKCYQLASGKRKELKKSLGTRDKRKAKLLVAKIEATTYSTDIGQFTARLITQEQIPDLKVCISNYIKEHQHLWQERHKQRKANGRSWI